MMDKHFVSSWLFNYIFDCAVSYGADAEALAETFDFELDADEESMKRVSFEKYIQLFEDAVRVSGNESIWARPIELENITRNNAAWFYGFNAGSLLEAANRCKKYFGLLTNSFYIDGFVEGNEFVSRLKTTSPEVKLSDYQSEATLYQWENTWVLFAGPAIDLKRIRTPVTDPERLKKYEDDFQRPVEGGCEYNDLVYDKAVANLPNINGGADPNLDIFFSHMLDQTMAAQKSYSPFEKTLVGLLQEEFQNGRPSVERVASRLGMGPRTLQRRLADMGYTYTEILQHYRHDLALEYLKQPQLNVTDVALMLGYNSMGSFSTAFQKRHGLTPKEYQQKSHK